MLSCHPCIPLFEGVQQVDIAANLASKNPKVICCEFEFWQRKSSEFVGIKGQGTMSASNSDTGPGADSGCRENLRDSESEFSSAVFRPEYGTFSYLFGAMLRPSSFSIRSSCSQPKWPCEYCVLPTSTAVQAFSLHSRGC